jgi:hypothetical protein
MGSSRITTHVFMLSLAASTSEEPSITMIMPEKNQTVAIAVLVN